MEILKTLNNTSWIKEIESQGRIFLVGGFVRDILLKKPSKDIDMVVEGIELNDLIAILKKHGKTDLVGESFAVIKFKDPNIVDDFDIAVCRTDRKIGDGHKGFEITSNASIKIEEDLFRRDITINSVAIDMKGNFVDPFNGRKDIEDRIIKATNPNAFADDPLRILRAIQMATRFDCKIDGDTFKMMIQNITSLHEISGERILEEFDKIVKKGNPANAIEFLISCNFCRTFGLEENHFVQNDEVKTLGDFMFALIGTEANGKKLLANRFKADNVTKKQFDVIFKLHTEFGCDAIPVLIAADLVKCSTPDPASADYIRDAAAIHKLTGQHEMGELFKVIAFGRNIGIDWQGFSHGDICHKL